MKWPQTAECTGYLVTKPRRFINWLLLRRFRTVKLNVKLNIKTNIKRFSGRILKCLIKDFSAETFLSSVFQAPVSIHLTTLVWKICGTKNIHLSTFAPKIYF